MRWFHCGPLAQERREQTAVGVTGESSEGQAGGAHWLLELAQDRDLGQPDLNLKEQGDLSLPKKKQALHLSLFDVAKRKAALTPLFFRQIL